MLPTKTHITQQGNLNGQKIDMQINADSLQHVMSILIDLYSDPEAAIAREYLTNALDAHIAAGNTNPIEITTPTHLSPFFKIKDYGIGLSVEDLKNIYSQYGASTKRNSNDQVGMLGLGCKSALTYTNQFTLRCVKGGKKSLVSVSRTDNGGGSLEVISVEDTIESNGVEVCIPVKNVDSLIKKIRKFVYYWNPNQILIDGKPPIETYKPDLALSDKIGIVKDTRDNYVVMGNVAYPVKKEYNFFSKTDKYYSRNFGIVAYVDIGDIAFSPSREELYYNDATINTLNKISEEVESLGNALIQKRLNSYISGHEALKDYCNNNSIYKYFGDFTYNGNNIPIDSHVYSGLTVLYNKYSNGFNYSGSGYGIYGKLMLKDLAVVNFPGKLTSTGKKKAKKYLLDNNLSSYTVHFYTDNKYAQWYSSEKVIEWKDIESVKIQYNKNKKQETELYKVMKINSSFEEITLDNKKQILYCSPTVFNNISKVEVALELANDNHIVIVNKNRHDDFQKKFPQSKELIKFVKEHTQKFLDSLSDEQKKQIALVTRYENQYINLDYIDTSRLVDKELVDKIKSIQNKSNIIKYYKNGLKLAYMFRMYEFYNIIENSGSYLYLWKEYPLANVSSSTLNTNLEHIYIYCNAVYQQRSINGNSV